VTSAPSKTTTTKVVNNKTGITTSTSTKTSGGSTVTTKTTTIGAAKTVSSPSTATKAAATLSHAALGSRWIAGPNESRQLCVPVAVANALLGATGTEASNAQIERLYKAAGGIGATGVPVPSALAAACSEGLAGCRLKSFRTAALDDADLLLLAFGEGYHAAAFAGMTVITWGDEIPLEDLDATIIDAWSLTWHGQKEATRG
jgi:hypothetical protein